MHDDVASGAGRAQRQIREKARLLVGGGVHVSDRRAHDDDPALQSSLFELRDVEEIELVVLDERHEQLGVELGAKSIQIRHEIPLPRGAKVRVGLLSRRKGHTDPTTAWW